MSNLDDILAELDTEPVGHPRPQEGTMCDHKCKRPHSCTCSSQALDPDEDCPVHQLGEWPPRCGVCGRFMKWNNKDEPWLTSTTYLTS
jgi:hypothetical protein